MKFGITIGSYFDPEMLRLNVSYVRKLFGDSTPMLVADDISVKSKKIEEIATQFGCGYICTKIHASHFLGDVQASVASIALARANDCDISLKLSQSLILLSSKIPKLIEAVFSDPEVNLALPGQCSRESILTKASFRSKFPHMTDFIAARSSAFEPDKVILDYMDQVRSSKSDADLLVETLWDRYSRNHKTSTLDWLTEHREKPFTYLRKAQNRPSDYIEASRLVGLGGFSYSTAEWSRRLGAAYKKLAL